MTRTDTEDSNDKIDIKYSGFYGTDTVWTLESKQEGEVAFEYNSIVSFKQPRTGCSSYLVMKAIEEQLFYRIISDIILV